MEPLLRIANHDSGERLDSILARTYPQYSRTFFQKFLKRGGAKLSGSPRQPDYRVHAGETFQVADPESFAAPAQAADPYAYSAVVPKILFEDNALLVIDKPAGLVVHPAPGHRVGTLIDWLKTHLGAKVVKIFTDPVRLGLVHRLDKDTSGVLVVAKSIVAQTAVARQFHDRTVQKTYVALIEGVPSVKRGIIDAPVGRSRKTPTRMTVASDGRASETGFEVQESLREVSLVSLHPKTGRTHQIRVHLSAIGHPIVGDRTYGAKSIWLQTFDVKRPLLHAERLKLAHPLSGKAVTFEAPWPEDFKDAHRRFRTAFKILGIVAAVTLVSLLPVHAEEHASHKTSASGSLHSLSSDVRRLKRDVAELQESLEKVNASMQKMDFSDRIRDLEHATSELNARAVSSTASAEEARTQFLDLSRKLKNQQETLEQLRDQVDRLNQQLIKQQASGTASGPGPAAKP